MNATLNAAQGIRREYEYDWHCQSGAGVRAAGVWLVTAIIKIITTLLCLIMKNIIFGITFGFCLCRRRTSYSLPPPFINKGEAARILVGCRRG